jgi:prevent-host-death family protein
MTVAGIRELRQNLSRYIDRVKAGETIEVTERGKVVAALVPRREREDELSALEARGLTITRARLDFKSLGPIPKPKPGQRPLTEILEEMRTGERY